MADSRERRGRARPPPPPEVSSVRNGSGDSYSESSGRGNIQTVNVMVSITQNAVTAGGVKDKETLVIATARQIQRKEETHWSA